MSREWTAEVVISACEARFLIEQQFPTLAPAFVELVGAGFDNTAFVVNGAYLFRFPRRQVAVPLMQTETCLLPVIAPRLPLAVPSPCFAGQPTGAFPWPFAGYPMLPGTPACAVILDYSQRVTIAAPLARFLAALHAIPPGEVTACGAGPDTMARLDLARRLPRARQSLDQLTNNGIIVDPKPLSGILDAAPPGYTPRADTLVHGDLYARHLLISPLGQLTGVIDWGDVHVGDPAIDLAIAFTFLPSVAHQSFLDAYGPVDEITWRIARLRALWHTLVVLIYGHDVNDRDLVREGLTALGYLAAGG